MKKILFVCGENRLRSPTAEAVFSMRKDWLVRSAGLKNNSDVQISDDDVEWAEYIFVMEKRHKKKVQENFKTLLKEQKLICLNIPDQYSYMDPELVRILESKVPVFVR